MRMRAAATGLVAGVLIWATFLPGSLTAPLPETVYLEEMTWVEVREAIDPGRTTVIVPTGGIEQNGIFLQALIEIAKRAHREGRVGLLASRC